MQVLHIICQQMYVSKKGAVCATIIRDFKTHFKTHFKNKYIQHLPTFCIELMRMSNES
jgi:hypothetical protein